MNEMEISKACKRNPTCLRECYALFHYGVCAEGVCAELSARSQLYVNGGAALREQVRQPRAPKGDRKRWYAKP